MSPDRHAAKASRRPGRSLVVPVNPWSTLFTVDGPHPRRTQDEAGHVNWEVILQP
jgi:hypothetical protein